MTAWGGRPLRLSGIGMTTYARKGVTVIPNAIGTSSARKPTASAHRDPTASQHPKFIEATSVTN